MKVINIPNEWKEIKESITGDEVVLFIGDVDTGKTSLINYLYRETRNGCIIDLDVGQSEIGPPTLITLSKDGERFEDAYFVGSTTPTYHFTQMITGTEKLLEKTVKPVYIDTTGYIQGAAARDLKGQLIELINPDITVLIGNKDTSYFKAMSNNEFIEIDKPIAIEKKEQSERIENRKEKFKRYFKESEKSVVDLNNFNLRRTILGSGEDIKKEVQSVIDVDLFRAEYLGSSLLLVSNEELKNYDYELLKMKYDLHELKVREKRTYEKLLVGLLDQNDKFLSLGIIEEIDFESLKAVIRHKNGVDGVESIQFGSVRILKNGKELGKVNII